MGGTPVFTGSRVPIQSLFDYLEYGETIEVFLDNFPGIAREQAIGVLRLAADLVKKEYSLHENLA
jgi:uncharacterized protein (DUF433 family)